MNITYSQEKNFDAKTLLDFFTVSGNPDAKYEETTAYIRYLVVAPNYRGKGINDELIAQVKAKYENYPYLFAFAPDNFHASFFSKLGFNVLDGAKVLAR